MQHCPFYHQDPSWPFLDSPRQVLKQQMIFTISYDISITIGYVFKWVNTFLDFLMGSLTTVGHCVIVAVNCPAIVYLFLGKIKIFWSLLLFDFSLSSGEKWVGQWYHLNITYLKLEPHPCPDKLSWWQKLSLPSWNRVKQ